MKFITPTNQELLEYIKKQSEKLGMKDVKIMLNPDTKIVIMEGRLPEVLSNIVLKPFIKTGK